MSTLRLSLGIIVGVLLLSAQSGAAPRPNSGGSQKNRRGGACPRPLTFPRPYGSSPFRSGLPELGRGISSPPPSVTLSFDDSFDRLGQALRTLIAALKDNPNARTFRASWSLLVFNNQTRTTILYDRRKHSLLFYSVGDGDVLGTQHDHFRFTRVPESVFGKIARAHRNDNSEDGWAWLGDLPQFGCRKVVLGARRSEPV